MQSMTTQYTDSLVARVIITRQIIPYSDLKQSNTAAGLKEN